MSTESDETPAQLASAIRLSEAQFDAVESTLNGKMSELIQRQSHIQQLEGKNRELEVLLKDLHSQLQQKTDWILNQDLALMELYHRTDEKSARIDTLEKELAYIRQSRFWKLMRFYTRLKSWTYLGPGVFFKTFKEHLSHHGARHTIKQMWQRIKNRRFAPPGPSGPLSLPRPEIYQQWFKLKNPWLDTLLQQRETSLAWEKRPLISLIVPVYNTPVAWLEALLQSILDQSYDRWEAVLVDDCSDSAATVAVLRHFANRDPRFRLILRPKNGGVAAACQEGLAAAKGPFFAVVDHDDLLQPDAIYHVADRIGLEPDVDVLYSDEALMDKDGTILECVFRPDYSYHRLLSHPYIVHLTTFRTALARQVGGFDRSFEASQDYDFLLRIAAATQRVTHIPKLLYLWRQHGESTGHQKMNKVMVSSIRALTRHLSLKQNKEAWVEPGLSFNFFRIRHPVTPAMISIIIPTRDRVDLLRRCINSLVQKTRLPETVTYEILVADNGSKDPETISYFRQLESQGHRVIPCPGPFNFSKINNLTARESRGAFVLFLNNDIEIVDAQWLCSLVEQAQQSDVGAVGAKLIYPDGLIQHAGVIVGINGKAGHSHQFFEEYRFGGLSGGHLNDLLCVRECLAVTAACLMVRREVFEAVGGFDETFKVGFGDTDLCIRIHEKGYRNLWTPYSRLIHYESASRGKNSDALNLHPEDTEKFCRRWASIIGDGDPYYNRNLSLSSPAFLPKDLSS